MPRERLQFVLAFAGLLLLMSMLGCTPGLTGHCILPEQRELSIREPAELPKAVIPSVPPPSTVSDPQWESPEQFISLDDAIRITLANSQVVRVLAGVSATTSNRTIYDPAISNTIIDQEQGRFDPRLEFETAFDRIEQPQGVFDLLNPSRARIDGSTRDGFHWDSSLSQTNITGGTTRLGFLDDRSAIHGGFFPLNPENRHALALSYTQPLLQGGGVAANLAPVVVARINTERSYFQFKDAMQESVRGVIEAYWALVFARTDMWARQQQVQQGHAAQERADARKRQGLGSAATVAQANLALANFKATLVAAEANVLQREAALRNIMFLPPTGTPRLVPITPPTRFRREINWDEIIRLAEEARPDLIELKLIIEADQQFLIQARNQALPKLDAVALYRWNGLEGTTPARTNLSTNGSEYTDWSVGVNFSVPLGLRQGRAAVRQQEFIIARDRANLDQGLHNAVHELATGVRGQAETFEQYKARAEAREAARINLDQQTAEFRSGRAIFLNVLEAITDWGNAVSAEALALTRYNTELANLERTTGTILETHGIHFYEERLGMIGPLGCITGNRYYPSSVRPAPNADRYPRTNEPAENTFDLKSPIKREGDAPEALPKPAEKP